MNELLTKLKEQQASREDNETEQTTKEIPSKLVVPDKLPEVGTFIRFVYGDPNMIGADPVVMPAVVTSFRLDGLVCGHAFIDPLMSGMGPNGQPVQLPATMPVGNVPYDPKGSKLSWHWKGDLATKVEDTTKAEPEETSDAEILDFNL